LREKTVFPAPGIPAMPTRRRRWGGMLGSWSAHTGMNGWKLLGEASDEGGGELGSDGVHDVGFDEYHKDK
jgi:hypothetical protein